MRLLDDDLKLYDDNDLFNKFTVKLFFRLFLVCLDGSHHDIFNSLLDILLRVIGDCFLSVWLRILDLLLIKKRKRKEN